MSECHVPNCATCAAVERVSREFHHVPQYSPAPRTPSRVLPVKSTTIETGAGPDEALLGVLACVLSFCIVVAIIVEIWR